MGYAGKINISSVDHSIATTLYGTCSTASGTAAKVVTCTDFTTLITGVSITVKFQYANTAANPTLNVNGTGAVPIYYKNTLAPGAAPMSSWQAGTVVNFTYDGSAWMMNVNPLLDLIYPVGSIYLSVNATNPGTLFGGTWVQIKDKFLMASGTTYTGTGGAASVTLSASNMPSHNHSIPALSGTAASTGAHTHGPASLTGYMLYGSDVTRSKVIIGGDGRAAFCGPTESLAYGTATASAGAHTHTVTTVANTSGSKGSGTAFSIIPPYQAIYVFKRTA